MLRIQCYITTLKRQVHRTHYAHFTLHAQGVPNDWITMFYGHDGHDYATATEMEAEFYETNGFQMSMPDFKRGRGEIGCFWSWIDCLHQFFDSAHELCYINQDDRVWFGTGIGLTNPGFEGTLYTSNFYQTPEPFKDVANQVQRLLEEDPDFKIFQLRYDLIRQEEFVDKVEFIATYLPISKGIFHSGDSGLILSKSGASLLLEEMRKIQNFPEDVLKAMARGDIDDSGCYMSTTPLRFTNEIPAAAVEMYGDDTPADASALNKYGNTSNL